MGLNGCTVCSHPARQCCGGRGGREVHISGSGFGSSQILIGCKKDGEPQDCLSSPPQMCVPLQRNVCLSRSGSKSLSGPLPGRGDIFYGIRNQKLATHRGQCQVVGRLVAFPPVDFMLVGRQEGGPGDADPAGQRLCPTRVRKGPRDSVCHSLLASAPSRGSGIRHAHLTKAGSKRLSGGFLSLGVLQMGQAGSDSTGTANRREFGR